MKRVDDFRLQFPGKGGKQEFVPIMIGGMGVDISTAELALEAARLGGIGHISDAMVQTVSDRRFKTRHVQEKLQIETGKWGFQKPYPQFMTAPCQEACPAGIHIPQFLYLTQEKMYDEALFTILRENPLPGVCGRVCFHPCEASCNRAKYDESVSIHAVERFVSDVTSNQIQDIQLPSNRDSKKVAVVGAGPAGHSCAYFLSLLGYHVTLFEAKKEPGGVMRWGNS